MNNWNSEQTTPEKIPFPTGKREAVLAAGAVIGCLCLCNFTLLGGFNLGFSISAVFCILFLAGYLILSGCKPNVYSLCLLGLSLIMAVSFSFSADGFMKFVMICWLFVSVPLGLSLAAGKQLRDPGDVRSVLDAGATIFRLGFGKIPEAILGLRQGLRRSGKVGETGGALLLGLLISFPILLIVVPLLISADAAFDGLIKLLPKLDALEIFATLMFAIPAFLVVYTQGVGLLHLPKGEAPVKPPQKIKLGTTSVNTSLGVLCFVYAAYLFSQLAYLIGGFNGILPEEFTLAEYARRGFFEMALLCFINLEIIVIFLSLRDKSTSTSISTKLLLLFIGLVSLFLVAAASGKMFLYIGSYGLTRKRLLTQIIMLFLALVTVFVIFWLFVPKLPYMKLVLLSGLLITSVTVWTDIDAITARYNVNAYLSGAMDTVDVGYLKGLSDSAVPYIAKLAEKAPAPEIAEKSRVALTKRHAYFCPDFRSWNYVNQKAKGYIDVTKDGQTNFVPDRACYYYNSVYTQEYVLMTEEETRTYFSLLENLGQPQTLDGNSILELCRIELRSSDGLKLKHSADLYKVDGGYYYLSLAEDPSDQFRLISEEAWRTVENMFLPALK